MKDGKQEAGKKDGAPGPQPSPQSGQDKTTKNQFLTDRRQKSKNDAIDPGRCRGGLVATEGPQVLGTCSFSRKRRRSHRLKSRRSASRKRTSSRLNCSMAQRSAIQLYSAIGASTGMK